MVAKILPGGDRQLLAGLTIPLLMTGAVIASAALGGYMAWHDSLGILKYLVGIPLIVAWCRYPYFLLVSWAFIDPFIGSNAPGANGNNFVTALTLPLVITLLRLPVMRAFKATPALAVFLLFLIWLLLGINASPLDHSTFLKEWLIICDYVGVAVLAMNTLKTPNQLNSFVGILLLSPVIIGLYGIFGYLTHQNVLTNGSGPARITSFFSDAPTLALLLSNVVPFAFYRVYITTGTSRIVSTSSLAILLTAIALSFTRGAIISMIVCITVMTALLPSIRMKLATVALMLAGAVGMILAHINIFQRFSSTDTTTVNGRTILWDALLANFDPRNLLGNGLGSSDYLLTHLYMGRIGQIGANGLIATSASNVYIAVLYEQGIIGLCLLSVVFLVLAISLIRLFLATSGDRRLLSIAALLTLVNVLIQSIDLNDVLSQSVGVHFWIMVSLPFAAAWFVVTQRSRDVEEPVGSAA